MAQPINRILHSPDPPDGDPGTVLVETERLIMRRYLVSDASDLAAAADYPTIADNLRDGFPSPYTLEDAESFLEDQAKPISNHYPFHAAIFIKPNITENPSPSPAFIGALGIIPGEDVEYRSWELGYWLTVPAWGRGFMTEAVRGFTRWMFETWPKLNRVEARTYSRNTQSGKLLKKCGFVEEGKRRAANEKHGVLLDETVYGLIRSDLEGTGSQVQRNNSFWNAILEQDHGLH